MDMKSRKKSRYVLVGYVRLLSGDIQPEIFMKPLSSLIKENTWRIVSRSRGARHPRKDFSNTANPTIAHHLYHRLDPEPCVLCGEVGSIIDSTGHELWLFAFRRQRRYVK